jgi:alkanesulfonate monooxygenase SsuD/methylene tetrahydromethanopterin reductase-like flavin-dependent oxidoreductase (luciferase family)
VSEAVASDANGRPGLVGFRISAVASQGINWSTLDATWALAGELDVFSAGWMSDHLTDVSRERGGGVFETVATAGALAHRVPGKWIGVAVFSNTFRHPSLLAKSAEVLDNATGGRFILGFGAGWHEGEHDEFGIPLPPPRERFDRFESAVRVLRALFSDEARTEPGVSLDDPFYSLHGATMEPGFVRAGGPPLWLGVGKPRGIRIAARYADGWPMPGNRPGDVPYFRQQRDRIRRALEEAGRDPDGFAFAGQLTAGATGAERREARETAIEFRRAGATHVIIGVPGRLGPDGLAAMAHEVAEPLREADGSGHVSR